MNFEKELELKGIEWKYPGAEKSVLKELDLKIKKGMSVGFVGASGAGKTTVADIILGLFNPQKGKILIDGKEQDIFAKSWHKMIGYVPQNVYLIDDSVRNNVAFGVDESQINDENIWLALEQAQLKDFVMWSQANGYQMHLYTNATLSGPLQQAVDSGAIQLYPLG